MLKAIWNGVILAQSDRCETVEGNYYFPPDTVNREYFKESKTHSNCFWKGEASYYNIEVVGIIPTPKKKPKTFKTMWPFILAYK